MDLYVTFYRSGGKFFVIDTITRLPLQVYVKVWGMLSSERYHKSSVNNNKINKY